jgi:hypothetical protein
MNKNGQERFYFCYACSFILFEKQLEGYKKPFLTTENITGIVSNMARKVNNFFNSPWVAFPLMFLLLIVFMWFGLTHGR